MVYLFSRLVDLLPRERLADPAMTARAPERPIGAVRAADVRFLLPRLPATASVLTADDRWAEGLQSAGVVVEHDGAPVDLVVCDRHHVRQAAERKPAAILAVGRVPGESLRGAGYQVRRLLAAPVATDPAHLVPLGDLRTARAAFGRTAPSPGARQRVRDQLGPFALAVGVTPPHAAVTLAVRGSTTPLLLEAAQSHGLRTGGRWWLSLGRGDTLQRAVLHVVHDDGAGHVIKFSRVPGYREAFDRDAAGLALAAEAGGAAAAMATELVARMDVAGHAAVVETRAPGRPLDEILSSTWRQERKAALVDAVARRLLDLAVETAEPPESLDRERLRLGHLATLTLGTNADEAMRSAAPTPGVLVHNDAGSWNVIVGNQGFRLVDWESAQRPGLPLWDLLYFLADALVLLAGPPFDDRVERILALFRGALPTSPILFRWVRQAVLELALPPASVAPLAALAWVHHGASPTARAAALQAFAGHAGRPAPRAPLSCLAAPWMADPELGLRWSSWR